MGLLTKGYLILKYPQRRKILRRDLGYTKASIDGVGIGGIRVSGTRIFVVGTRYYLNLQIYQYTKLPMAGNCQRNWVGSHANIDCKLDLSLILKGNLQ